MAIHNYPMAKLVVTIGGACLQLIANENQIISASKVLAGNWQTLNTKVLYRSLSMYKGGAIQKDKETFTSLVPFLSEIQRLTGVNLNLK